jgi:hypothetical protein
LESYFRPNGRKSRAITELINRYRNPFWTRKNSTSGALPEIDMTWLLFSLGLLRCFCRAKWTKPAVHRLNGYDFAVFLSADDGELQEKIV